MILRILLKELPPETKAAFIVTPAVSPKGLLCLLLEELGMGPVSSSEDLGLMLKKFQDALL